VQLISSNQRERVTETRPVTGHTGPMERRDRPVDPVCPTAAGCAAIAWTFVAPWGPWPVRILGAPSKSPPAPGAEHRGPLPECRPDLTAELDGARRAGPGNHGRWHHLRTRRGAGVVDRRGTAWRSVTPTLRRGKAEAATATCPARESTIGQKRRAWNGTRNIDELGGTRSGGRCPPGRVLFYDVVLRHDDDESELSWAAEGGLTGDRSGVVVRVHQPAVQARR
jgi:hypothetical protein